MTRRENAARHLSTRVVVVGAGPVGLLLACELRRARVPVVVVDRLAAPMTESRASQLSTLTAELLHERGFDALLAEAGAEPRAHFGGLPYGLAGLDSRYAGNWKVPQFRTESALGERAERLGANLLRSCELTEIKQLPDRVSVGLAGPDGDLRISARYVVGCDGAHSTVRGLCGFGVSATKATKELLRADITGLAIADRRFQRLPGGLAVSGTRDGVTRVMVHAAGQGVTERAGPPAFAEIVRLWDKVTGEDISAGNPIWMDSFDNAMGQADDYRLGRVLLAGDAAHWHMPIGGQALNVGLQDAVNLGWKLAGTVHGWAPPRVLDSYHAERHPVAARVLAHVAAQELLLLGDEQIEPLRAVLAELIGLDAARVHLAMTTSNLDVRYGDEPGLAGRRIAHIRLRSESGLVTTAGLLAGTRPVIVRLAPAAGPAADLGRVRTIHAVAEPGALPGITTLLVRPDGYIAWAGNDEQELSVAIGQWFRAKGGKEHAQL